MTGSRGRVRRDVRALGAAMTIVAIVAGVPAIMIALDLVPHRVPGLDEVWHTLTGRDTGQVALVVICAGVWLCWALFTISLLGEIVALMRQVPSRAWPGMAGFQRVAAGLLTAVVIGLNLHAAPAAMAAVPASAPIATSVAAPAANPLTISASPSAAVTVSAAPAKPRHQAASPMTGDTQEEVSPDAAAGSSHGGAWYQVQPRDTLWGIADAHLGDPMRYPEIIAANPGAVGADNEITAGSMLRLPAAPDGGDQVVIVEQGDTLSDIAADHDTSWQELWQANKGTPAPGGRVFTDPNLIWPDQQITIPSSPTEDPAETGQPAVPEPASAPAAQPDLTVMPGPALAPAVAGPASAEAPEAAAPLEAAPAASAAPEAVAPAPDNAGASWPLWASAGAGTPLLAGLIFLAWQSMRRRQRRWRMPGDPIAVSPPSCRETERMLRTRGPAAADDATRMDTALRSLAAAARSGQIAELPQLVTAIVGSGQIELHLARAQSPAPAPWQAVEGQAVWLLPAGAHPIVDESSPGTTLAPYPALVSIGHSPDGRQWLVDLEQVGGLKITGPAARCGDLLRFMAAELAHNTWSEMLEVTCYGLGDDIARINPDRVTVADDDRLVIEAKVASREIDQAEADRREGTSVLACRVAAGDREVPTPRVLLVADPVGAVAVAPVQAAAASGIDRSGIAVVTYEPDDAEGPACAASVDEHGVLRVPMLGIEVTAQSLPAAEAAPLAELMAASREVEPLTATGDPTAGELYRPASTPWGVDVDRERSDSSPVEGSREVGNPDAMSVGADAPSRRQEADNVVQIGSMPTAATDGPDTLDADLADWLDPEGVRPKVSLLGPVVVAASGSLPADKPRLAWHTEVVALLACRPRGLSPEQLSTSLWPTEPYTPGRSKVRQAAAAARRWLGADPDTGEAFLPANGAAVDAVYRLSGVLVDADLFDRLRRRASRRGDAGWADLTMALSLVSGIPFDRRRAGGYGWLADDPLDETYAAAIVDVAHQVAQHHLVAGEPQAAAAAARVALAAGSCEDTPLLDLAAACEAQGMSAERNDCIRRILTNHDAEVEEDLPPHTFQVLHDRGWLATAS